jgi:hypothetical protein
LSQERVSVRRRRFAPWPSRGDFDEHLDEDARVHGETRTALGTILEEVRAGNALTDELRTTVAALSPYGAEIVEGAVNRRWRKQAYNYLVSAAKGAGWIAAFVGAMAAVAAVVPGFHDWLLWVVHSRTTIP